MNKTTTEKKTSPFLTDYYSTSFFLLVLLFLVASAFVLLPLMSGIKAKNAEIGVGLDRLTQERTYLHSLEQSIVAAENIPTTVLSRVDQALPRESNIPELLTLLGGVAEMDGVKLDSVNFLDAKPTKAGGAVNATSSIVQTNINISVTAANYPQIKRFLSHLESSLRILDVVGINVTLKGEKAIYAIQLTTYAYRPPVIQKTAEANKKL
ncbi:MAG: type 4a pilus biogenesis protein PilO [Patescibacteria group bacterium]